MKAGIMGLGHSVWAAKGDEPRMKAAAKRKSPRCFDHRGLFIRYAIGALERINPESRNSLRQTQRDPANADA